MFGHTDQLPVSLPAGLDELPPGAELSEALAGVLPEKVSGYDVVSLAEVAYRQATYSRAVFLRAVAESGLRAPGSAETVEHLEHPSEFSPDEVRAALVWSRTRAESTFWFAHTVFVRIPKLGEAMLSGELDETRAKAFADWTSGLSDEHAKRVCEELLAGAASLLVGQLIDRIKRLAISLDPEWAQRRYDEAVKTRRVESWQGTDGTANVAGRDLPAERAQAGTDRINSLARAAKSAGDRRAIDAIRADLFLGMLDGNFVGLTDRQIVEHLLAHPIVDCTTDDAATDNAVAAHDVAAPEGNDSPLDDDAGAEEASNYGFNGESGTYAHAASLRSSGSSGFEPELTGQWSVSELRVELSTLLGLDRHPAELPGLGYVPAGVALDTLPRMLRGQWRFVVCDADGAPICSGITLARPRLEQPGGVSVDPRGRGMVELQLTAPQLEQWREEAATGKHAAWSAVISDIGDRVDAGALDGAVAGAAASGDVATADEFDVHRRVARAGLRRWIGVRDRVCRHPACRMPARRLDQDHRTDYAAGGLTTEENLDSLCRHDHRLIHEGGWITRKGDAGEIIWISALGHTYVTRPPPVMMP